MRLTRTSYRGAGDWTRTHDVQIGNLGKKIAPAFITMLDTRFVFKQPFYYFEADRSAPSPLGSPQRQATQPVWYRN